MKTTKAIDFRDCSYAVEIEKVDDLPDHSYMVLQNPKTGAMKVFARGRNRKTGRWTVAELEYVASPWRSLVSRNMTSYGAFRTWQTIRGNLIGHDGWTVVREFHVHIVKTASLAEWIKTNGR